MFLHCPVWTAPRPAGCRRPVQWPTIKGAAPAEPQSVELQKPSNPHPTRDSQGASERCLLEPQQPKTDQTSQQSLVNSSRPKPKKQQDVQGKAELPRGIRGSYQQADQHGDVRQLRLLGHGEHNFR